MAPRRDPDTLDLFAWQPPEVVQRYDERAVMALSWRDRVSRAVRETLNSSALSRPEIAGAMSAWLGEGEEVPTSMLDAYASQAREGHTISYLRMIALGVVTGDPRLLQLAAEPLGRVVIEDRYLGAIQEAQATEQIERLEQMRKVGRRKWRGRP